MKSLLKKWLSHTKRNTSKIVSEQAFFRRQFMRYYAKIQKSGEVQFWSHKTEQHGFRNSMSEKMSYYLGKYENDRIVRQEDFYQLPYHIQLGAERLFEEFLQTLED